jgi:hypothetical protein
VIGLRREYLQIMKLESVKKEKKVPPVTQRDLLQKKLQLRH